MRPVRLLALGDSYTIGESVPEDKRWPVLLASRLRAEGLTVEEPLIVARSGWTGTELLSGIQQAGIQGTYDLVFLLIGVNNQYRVGAQETYRKELRELLAKAIQFTSGDHGKVIVLSIPDWGLTPFAQGRDRQKIAAEIDTFNAINRREAEGEGAAYIDVTPLSRQASNTSDLIAEDGLHPSGLMYAAWVDLMLPVVLEKIKDLGLKDTQMLRSVDDSLAYARSLDFQDPLAGFRQEFVIADTNTIYLDGNSLGRLPVRTSQVMQQSVEVEWGERLIRGWNEGWFDLPAALAARLAALLGAQADEIYFSDSTSVNLFKLATAALRAQPERRKIISDVLNFPSDLYILQGIIDLLQQGHRLELVPSGDGMSTRIEDIRQVIDDDTALVCLSHVAFKSAFLYNMAQVTELAHEAGALVLWDLSHSAGVVPIQLNAWQVDLAVGCSYKYLNGGPGAPAYLYVRRDLQEKLVSPLWGWFADRHPFRFELDFVPAPGAQQYAVGTPPVLSLKAIEPALELVQAAGIERLRQKSLQQSEYLFGLAEAWLYPLGFSLGSPLPPQQRGSHVSLRHPEGYRISRAMIEPQTGTLRVIPDFRTPDHIRLGVAPLYNTFEEIHRALGRMRQIVASGEFERFSSTPLAVT